MLSCLFCCLGFVGFLVNVLCAVIVILVVCLFTCFVGWLMLCFVSFGYVVLVFWFDFYCCSVGLRLVGCLVWVFLFV